MKDGYQKSWMVLVHIYIESCLSTTWMKSINYVRVEEIVWDKIINSYVGNNIQIKEIRKRQECATHGHKSYTTHDLETTNPQDIYFMYAK